MAKNGMLKNGMPNTRNAIHPAASGWLAVGRMAVGWRLFGPGQPAIGLYSGLDWEDPVGDYKVPNKFGARIVNWKSEVVVPKVDMRTKWAKDVTPDNAWNLYPRPQFRRKNWTNLNGHWNYAVTGKGRAVVGKVSTRVRGAL